MEEMSDFRATEVLSDSGTFELNKRIWGIKSYIGDNETQVCRTDLR